MHLALKEEMTSFTEDHEDCKKNWERVFTKSFLKVDAEVRGTVSSERNPCPTEPIAPETVGSTAVVAVVFSSHIIISNCGDSRAVICRGKQPIPLSVDHKVIFYLLRVFQIDESIFICVINVLRSSRIGRTNMRGLKMPEER